MVLLPLAGSQCGLEGPRVSIDEETRPLYFEQIARGQRAALTDTVEIVIEDNETWTRYSGFLGVAPPDHPVDFDQMMVLLVAVPAESGGYDVSFRSVEAADSVIVAHYVLGVPDDDCMTAMGITTPFQAVSVPRVDLPVVFERGIERVRCTLR